MYLKRWRARPLPSKPVLRGFGQSLDGHELPAKSQRLNPAARPDRIAGIKSAKGNGGVLIFKDQVIRARSFTWFHSAKFSALPFRLNRFLQVDAPTLEA